MLKINLLTARIFILLNPFSKLILVCKGYNEDYLNYTEIVRRDDLLNMFSENDYYDFEIWRT